MTSRIQKMAQKIIVKDQTISVPVLETTKEKGMPAGRNQPKKTKNQTGLKIIKKENPGKENIIRKIPLPSLLPAQEKSPINPAKLLKNHPQNLPD